MPTIVLKQSRQTPKEKRCMKCLKTQPIESFEAMEQSIDGHSNECKDCTSIRKRKWREAHPDYMHNDYIKRKANASHKPG